MGKFNKAVSTGVISPVKTVGKTVNYGGKAASKRDTKSELFLLAVSNFVGQDTFYESAKSRDDRFSSLCRTVAIQDSVWFLGFVEWLRNEAFMRSASIVAAAEGVKALLDSGNVSCVSRAVVAASMARADEPGEFLAYWTSKYGRNFPAAVKKGVADAVRKLYNEDSLLKYDTDSKDYRFGDVIQLTHPAADSAKQNALFKYAIDLRYSNVSGIPDELSTISTRANLMSAPVEKRKALIGTQAGMQTLYRAGMTWEALSGWLQGPMDKQAWEAVIPSMGYMALLRNLRNFMDAGVSVATMKKVFTKLSDPEQVAKSKQFPFRFLAAYRANKSNLKVAAVLEEALEASLSNVPSLTGRTLILVDRSGSMFQTHQNDHELTMADKAAIFGSALALRAENADLVQFGSSWGGRKPYEAVSFRKRDSLLPMLNKFRNMGGTDTLTAVQGSFKNHDRVIIITDEQYNGWGGDPLAFLPAKTPVYTWNLEGYKAGHGDSGSKKRHTFGGLTDKGFQMIPLIEAGQAGTWPWLVNA
jgi:hypothetical protein